MPTTPVSTQPSRRADRGRVPAVAGLLTAALLIAGCVGSPRWQVLALAACQQQAHK